ncbi:uncharacterized protein ASPGLDRAFT_410632 [Aspergillus glaucus CBS 516.65]|uniref:Uncharacterized protein n=1 Tax=Aspergillus glaucus CBS 516.65 TaxID=1160497 RepID=A0A1L9VHX0_ASPGL|nr:hypothetical protein ASPGLDRAFT_410632 [Aspergillus glaucus CBS 516.65]OJJ83526.1 hypothetical protein ASPGLDRAFT_410632 [Aspergillus glaucus CBS 516.65]
MVACISSQSTVCVCIPCCNLITVGLRRNGLTSPYYLGTPAEDYRVLPRTYGVRCIYSARAIYSLPYCLSSCLILCTCICTITSIL